MRPGALATHEQVIVSIDAKTNNEQWNDNLLAPPQYLARSAAHAAWSCSARGTSLNGLRED
jgi:hypothetical protein